mmetsp:Transcript_93857/g.303761  ORF Transcript_93857/g.303761 Transcript_93857/m.303761 type:complete len:80 (+) Transcript_93857:970-1209(+)
MTVKVLDNMRSRLFCVHALITVRGLLLCILKGNWQLLIHATCSGTVKDTPVLPNCEPLHGSKNPKRKQNANRCSKADGI